MMRSLKYIFAIAPLIAALPALAAAPEACRRELDETYNAPDEASLNIALQNFGLCMELELYPREVKEFLAKESDCIHIAGEEPYSGERAVELERLNKINSCDTTTEDKQKLLKKYKKDPVIVRALKNYGNKIYPGRDSSEAPIDNPQEESPPGNMLQNNNEGGVI